MERIYHLMTFSNTMAAMSMLNVMENSGVTVHLMPIPKCISASCGLSFRYPPELDAQVRELAARSEIPRDDYSVYHLDFTGGKQIAEKL